MNKKIVSIILICLIIEVLTGCDSLSSFKNDTDQKNPSSYQYHPNNGGFRVISVEKIDDGTNGGITISTLVDKRTNVMYLQTEKFQSGYGVGLQVL
jgi:hypothetical protein